MPERERTDYKVALLAYNVQIDVDSAVSRFAAAPTHQHTFTAVEPLQRIQNTAARLIFNLGKREHVSPCLIQLHWLPIRYRITYKLCTLMHNVYIGKSPRYLADIVQPTISRVTRSGLRSLSETDSYTTPRLRTKLGERAFPSPVQRHGTLSLPNYALSLTLAFKNKLRTYLLGWRSTFTFSRLLVHVLCIPDFSVSVLLTFISAYMFLR